MPDLLHKPISPPGYKNQLLFFVKYDFIRMYHGSLFGWFWAFARPLVILFVYWAALRYGLRAGSNTDESYFVWLALGVFVWTYISEINGKGTNIYRTYRHVVTKMKFPLSVPPIATSIAQMILHVMLVGPLLVLFVWASGGEVTRYWIQLPLYAIVMFGFVSMWSVLSASLGAISKDFKQFIRSINRILLWISPILWNVRDVDAAWLVRASQFNPIAFFTEGYRKSIIHGEWFFQDMGVLLIFAAELILLALATAFVYRRVRKGIIDAL